MKELNSLFSREQITSGEKIKRYRESYEISQNELCEILGISQNNLSAIENGKRNLGLKTAVKICALFPIRLEDLLFPNGIEKEEAFKEVKDRAG